MSNKQEVRVVIFFFFFIWHKTAAHMVQHPPLLSEREDLKVSYQQGDLLLKKIRDLEVGGGARGQPALAVGI